MFYFFNIISQVSDLHDFEINLNMVSQNKLTAVLKYEFVCEICFCYTA